MHIERSGNGPDLVLLHGWAMHGGVVAPLAAALGRHWTVHCVDLPGHGHSRADSSSLDPTALVAALLPRLPRALWVGWSLGGLVAQQAALTAPEGVAGMVSLAGPPRFVAAPDWPHGVAGELFARFGAELAADWRGTVERFLALAVIGSEHARSDLRVLRSGLYQRGEPGLQALADGLAVLATTDLRAQLPDLSVPSLWLTGECDYLAPPPAMAGAAALAPAGVVMVLEGAGHAPFLQHAGAIAAAVAPMRGLLA